MPGPFQALNTVIQMQSTTLSSPTTGQVWWDGTNLRMNIGGTNFYLTNAPVGSQYTVSNITPTRTLNGSLTTIASLGNVVGTLLQDMQTSNL